MSWFRGEDSDFPSLEDFSSVDRGSVEYSDGSTSPSSPGPVIAGGVVVNLEGDDDLFFRATMYVVGGVGICGTIYCGGVLLRRFLR